MPDKIIAQLYSTVSLISDWQAYLDSDDNCRTVFAKVPFVTHSSSEGMGKSSGKVPRVMCTGSITRFGKGIFGGCTNYQLILLNPLIT